MNYTENYHLPQWEETDRIMRVDFNEAMANIDSGILASSCVVGGYIGLGLPHPIHLGFRPKAVIIFTMPVASNSPDGHQCAVSAFMGTPQYHTLEFLDDGFKLYGNIYEYPNINRLYTYYGYIAFR